MLKALRQAHAQGGVALGVYLLAALSAAAMIFLLYVWSRPTAQPRPRAELPPRPARPAPAPGAFNLSDPVHLLAVILVGVLVLALLTC